MDTLAAEGRRERRVARWPLMRWRRFRSASLWLRQERVAGEQEAGIGRTVAPSVSILSRLEEGPIYLDNECVFYVRGGTVRDSKAKE